MFQTPITRCVVLAAAMILACDSAPPADGPMGSTEAEVGEVDETSSDSPAAQAQQDPQGSFATPDDRAQEDVHDAEDPRVLPRIAWTDLSDSGTSTAVDGFRLTLSNPYDHPITADLMVAYDLGTQERFMVEFAENNLAPQESLKIDLGDLVPESAQTRMKYAGSAVVVAQIVLKTDEDLPPLTVSSSQIFFHPDPSGLRLLSESALYASDHAGDFTGEHGGRERKADLEATLGHPTNLRITDGASR